MTRRGPLQFFLLNPTLALVLLAACLIGGGVASFNMVRENYPDLAIPQAVIATEWPGASPEQMEKEVTKPIEDAIRALPRLKFYESSSSDSLSLIILQFDADVEIPFAMQELRARISEAESRFPTGVKKPDIQQVSVNDMPVASFVLSGDVGEERLNLHADKLKRRLEELSGVRAVRLQGARPRAVQIRLDTARLASLGIATTTVRDRIRSANRDLAWGELETETATRPIYLAGRAASVTDLRAIQIATLDDGTIIRLGDVAEVFIGLDQEDGTTQVSIDGADFRPAISMSIVKRPGSDTVATIEDVGSRIAEVTSAPDWPASIVITTLNDEREVIRDSFRDVTTNLIQGAAAVFLVLLIALTWREAIVAAIAMPVALLAALVVVDQLGFTLNTLTILGMVIALGLLVDVFILVMEGMHDGLYIRGLGFDDAARATVKAYLMPAIAGQATTVLALLPLMLIGGIDGKFIRLIPLTAISCLVASLGVAFLIAVPLSRFVLAHKVRPTATPVDRATLFLASRVENWLLQGPLRSKGRAAIVIALAFFGFLVSAFLAESLPSILYPKEDRRTLGITVSLPPDATLADAERVALKAGQSLRDLPYFASVTTHAAEKSPFALHTIDEYLLPLYGSNMVGVSVLFKPKDARAIAAYEALPEIRERLVTALSDEPGLKILLSPDLGGATSAAPIQIRLTGDDPKRLHALSKTIQVALAAIPGVNDIRDTIGPFKTETRFTLDPDVLAYHRLNEAEVMQQVRFSLTTDKIDTFKIPGTDPDLDINLGAQHPSRDGQLGGPRRLYELETTPIVTEDGATLLLPLLADMKAAISPRLYLHRDGRRTNTIKAQLAEGTTASSVVERLSPLIADLQANLPAGYKIRWAGEVEATQETFGGARQSLILAGLFVTAILILLFGSFLQPFIIMAMVPIALTGTFIGFSLLAIPMSFPAMIGIIALVGIVVNDAIVMVEVINERRREGKSAREAAALGASDRLRPIVTTSLTTIAGLLPLAFSAPAWYPLCMAVILGLGLATLLVPLLVPCLYVLLSGSSRRHQYGAEAPAPTNESELKGIPS
ncbi:acriflavin resistance protein [Nitratireductor aquibiodomus RA22]|uniref:Acriflavin resistance protein n=1 Tax=Nitratireductor aquibiodomus RA22 TaxID=1189611 RepID=I5BSW2_9HYPH|nr:efflux RND transporter permease subunit [Nitratireductor aquibiodomus]EIM72664.1 acriflavin resistance protein [Nitratireductor aquibiodomus RA22]